MRQIREIHIVQRTLFCVYLKQFVFEEKSKEQDTFSNYCWVLGTAEEKGMKALLLLQRLKVYLFQMLQLDSELSKHVYTQMLQYSEINLNRDGQSNHAWNTK